MNSIDKFTLDSCGLDKPGINQVTGVLQGFDAFWLSKLARDSSKIHGRPIIHISRDDSRLRALADNINFFDPNLKTIIFPAWDCLPFDRVSPRADIISQRLLALCELLSLEEGSPAIFLTTLNAALQRIPPRSVLTGASKTIKIGDRSKQEELALFFEGIGYVKVGSVMEVGEYAIRGGILDIYPAAQELPIRIDFFGNEIEVMKSFDPITQRSIEQVQATYIGPAGEVFIDNDSIARFQKGYRSNFGAVIGNDPLFEAVSSGMRYPGFEHWHPLFYDKIDTIFDYLPIGPLVLDHFLDQALIDRNETISDYFQARKNIESGVISTGSTIYKPLNPSLLYMDENEWLSKLAERPVAKCLSFSKDDKTDAKQVFIGAHKSRDFTPERKQGADILYKALVQYIKGQINLEKKLIIAAWSPGTRERLKRIFSENQIGPLQIINEWSDVSSLGKGFVGLAVMPLDQGFDSEKLVILAEQDILGSRLNRNQRRKRKKAINFIASTSEITDGDLVVHLDHGIGVYHGLVTVEVNGAPHDCLRLVYSSDDKLLLPVEHIDLLSRYGSADLNTKLDRLGGVNWQARKARLKKKVREMAEGLIATAAQRSTQKAPIFEIDIPEYDKFCSRFKYVETDDQADAIDQTLQDLLSGSPMDRLICGDVGFGKTEVALRAAFSVAMSGMQVAVLVPTTLLCRQHYESFKNRFNDLPIKVSELSRLSSKQLSKVVKHDLESGQVDIIIGTHALLAKDINIPNLGLVIVDEEQHFGVSHKERLKLLKSNTHVLTLTATPIPRTLQMSLSGVRSMSVIASPPVDRLAVRTFIMPFDQVVIREAILREQMRGGQTFYVCPRVADIRSIVEELNDLVPEVKVISAHGQMAPADLEDTMGLFYKGNHDVLVSTAIIESGLDIPRVNTMIVHRSDMFGLAQLYQLRGRIGRSKLRGYAYITFPSERSITNAAFKRLEVIHRLDSLGAGFALASYDLDIRGAGNLLGPEQSGHVREVGVELYQKMLEDAILDLKSEGLGNVSFEEKWSPQINIGASVLIPDKYVTDLHTRLGLYRRIAELEEKSQTEDLIVELTDRFGPPPESVLHLLEVIVIKYFCRKAGVEKVDAGPKGAVFTFRNDTFNEIPLLVEYVSNPERGMRLRPDSRLVVNKNWIQSADRLEGVSNILNDLCGLVNTQVNF